MKEKMSLMKLSENIMKDVKAGVYNYFVSIGHSCGCGCYYSETGGSSTFDNGDANMGSNLRSEYQ